MAILPTRDARGRAIVGFRAALATKKHLEEGVDSIEHAARHGRPASVAHFSGHVGKTGDHLDLLRWLDGEDCCSLRSDGRAARLPIGSIHPA